jgi:hypothetical protein
MSSFQTRFPRLRSQKSAMSLGFLIVAGVAAYEIATSIINNDLTVIFGLGLIMVVGLIFLTILNNWRTGLLIFLVWLLFEDFARKYLGNNMIIYLAKDFLVLIVYFSFYKACRQDKTRIFRPSFRIPLLAFIWFGVIQVFNPASPSLFFGVMGLKMFFLYVPLIIVGYHLFDSEKALERFFYLNLACIVLIGSLGIAQAILGHTFLNPQIMQDDIRELSSLYRVSPITGTISYRPTSIFVSAGRFADYLGIAWLTVLGFTGYLLLRRRRGQSLAFLALASTSAAMALCASRGAFVYGVLDVVVTSIAFVWGAPWRQQQVIRVFRTIQRAGLGIVAAAFLLVAIFPEALMSRLSFYYETMSPNSAAGELAQRTQDYPIQNFLAAFDNDHWPYGYGIGTSALGIQYIVRIFKVRPLSVAVESGFGTLVVEMGIVGLFLWIVVSAAIVFSAWNVVRHLKGSPFFPIAFVIFWYSFVLLFLSMYGGIQAYEDFVLNAYLWLLLGILYRLPTLASSAQAAALVTTNPY